MSVDYIYTGSSQRLPTPNDVTILASAPEVTDSGYVHGSETYFPNPSGYIRNAGITMNGANNRLTIGGNNSVAYNISYIGRDMHQEVAAARFTGNGTIVFSAQSGANRASEVNKDSDLSFRVEAIGRSNREDVRTTYSNPAVNISDATVFKADGDLTVAGDVAGTFEAVSDTVLDGYKVKEGDKFVYKNNSTGQSGIALGFHSTNFVVGNNFKGELSSKSTGNITAIVAGTLQAQNNTFEALGIRASGNVTADQGLWQGHIDAAVTNSLIRADVDLVVPDDKGEKKAGTATVSGNKLNATGIEAGGTVNIKEMTDGDNITASATGNMLAAHTANSDAAGVINFTDNVISSYGIDAGTLKLETFNSSASISTTTGGNTYSIFIGPFKGDFNVNWANNKMTSIALNAGSMTVDNFLGSIQSELSYNVITLNGNLGVESSDNRFIFQVAGINVSDTLTSTASLYGTIRVVSVGNQMVNLYDWQHGKTSVILAYGINAKTISVTGMIESQITISVNNYVSGTALFNVNSVFGIKADNLTVSAFSGTIRFTETPYLEMQFGIYAQNGFHTDVKGDAFDMAGTIYIRGSRSFGIYSEDTLNLRVSGSITAYYAIKTEGRYNEKQGDWTYVGNPNRKDQVELSNTAVINGIIDLGGDENTIIINCGARVFGNLLASDGKLNMEFVLDDYKQLNPGHAIVTTDVNDISLTSAGTLTVNLNNAVNGQSYTLFSYDDADTQGDKIQGHWLNKSVTFVYKGQTKTIAMKNGVGSETFDDGAKVTIQYQDGVVTVAAAGVVANKELGATLIGTVGGGSGKAEQARAYILEWKGGATYEQYELEYTINGKSVVVKLNGNVNSYQIKGLAGHETSAITWKVRGVNGKGTEVSQWQAGENYLYDPSVNPATSVVTLPGNAPYIANPDDSGAGITSAIAKFSWGRAQSSNGYAIKNYTVEYFGSGVKLDEDKISAIFAGTDKTEKVYTKTVNATEALVSSLTNQHFVYWRVKAYDVYGNESDYYRGEDFRIWVGDNVAPVFDPQENNGKQAGVTLAVDRTDPYNVKMNLTFGWCNATDSQSQVKQYVIEYKKKDQSWDEAARHVVLQGTKTTDPGTFEYNWATTVDGGLYDYRIYAVDFVGNQTDPYAGKDFNGSFGYSDLQPPTGAFTGFLTPVVTVNKITNTDEFGNVSYTITGATVSFAWTDSYVDESGVRYIVEFSNNKNFLTSGSTNGVANRTSSITTTSDDKNLVLGNNVGNASGLLSGMTTVYWRVKAADTLGNQSAVWGNGDSFEFRDPDTGAYIKDSSALTAPTSLYHSANEQNVTFSWYGAAYNFGLKGYELHYIIGGKEKVVSGITTNSVTVDLERDGICTWWVVAINGDGSKTATSKSDEFLLDSAAPSWEQYGDEKAGLLVTPARNNPILSWNAAIDDGSGVSYYLLEYKIAGSDVWNSQKVTDTKAMLDLVNGNYVFRVTAVDANGNQLTSDEKEFAVGDSLDFADTRSDADRQAAVNPDLVITAGAGIWRNDVPDHVDTSLGVKDSADWYKLQVGNTAEMTITVDGLASTFGNSTGITIRVRDYNDKILKTLTVKSLAAGQTASLSLILSPVAGTLNGTNFYIEVVSNNGDAITEYHFKVDSSTLPVNNEDDTRVLVDGIDPKYTVTIDPKAPADGTHVRGDLFVNEWVGYDDKVDYRKVVVTQDGSYTIRIDGLVNKVKLTVWSVDEKNPNKLKSVKSITVTPKRNKDGSWSIQSGALADLLLKNGTYYVSVENPGANKGANTGYEVTLDGEVFNRLDNSYKNNFVAGYKKSPVTDAEVLTTNISKADSRITDVEVITGEWVGFADAIDFQRVTFEAAGNYTFRIDGVDSKVKLTVWGYDAKGNLKALKTLSVTPKGGDVSAELKPLLLEAGKEYFVSVEATNWKKNENTDYNVTVSGDVFNHAGNGYLNNFVAGYKKNPATDAEVLTTNISKASSEITDVAVITGEWVGFGDTIDFQRVVFEADGNYTFKIDGVDGKVKLTVWGYDAKGNLKALKTLSVTPKGDNVSAELKPLLLEAGKEYFVSVEATNWKKGEGTDYNVTVSGDVFNHAGNGYLNNFVAGYKKNPATDAEVLTTNISKAQSRINDVQVISGEWVGFGDAIDFQRVIFEADGNYTFKIDGVDGKVKLTVWGYDAKGNLKALKTLSVTPKGDNVSAELNPLLLEAGKEYFVSVEATNWKKGEGTDYNVTVSGDVFNNPGNSLANSTWDAADVRALTPGVTVANEWVGFGDANDFHSLTVAAGETGAYTFRLSTSEGLNGLATVTVYQKLDDGKGGYKLKSLGKFTNSKADSTTLELGDGEYFVDVMSADKGKGKKNTDYSLEVIAPPAPQLAMFPMADDGVSAAMQSLAMDSLAGLGSAMDGLTGKQEEQKNPLFSVL